MKAAEIRERFLSFFEERDHLRVPSASLVPPSYDPSVLLTTAGMQPFKPYFRGEEEPPSRRLTSCQKVLPHHRHRGGRAARTGTSPSSRCSATSRSATTSRSAPWSFALELSTEGFGLALERIWITVFGGDEELGLGPDEEAIECWRAVGVPDERIVRLGRADNFWQSGPTGPCGPCSELYLDRGPEFGSDDDRPGDDTERFLEFWNLVFMQYELGADGSLTPLPSRNIDTGLGLDRMAAILQDVESVFETDQLRPLRRAGRGAARAARTGHDDATTRALRILADHGRGATFLLADGVVPSNEDRGYILRRIMRRAMHQGRVLGHRGRPARAAGGADRRGDGRRLPGAAPRVADHRALGARGGGGLRPHARAGRAAAGRARGRRDAPTARRGSPRRTRSSCTTPTASRTS